MKKFIYYTTTIIMFVVITMGLDTWFGEDIKNFSILVFILWIAQMLSRDWDNITEIFKTLYGIKK